MKTNSLLTYLLYALLIALIAVLGYKACQMKKDKAEKVKNDAELQKTLRDLGYASDSTASGSSYTSASDSSAYYTSPSPDADGIVDAPSTTTGKTNPTTSKTPATNKSTSTSSQPASQSSATTPPTEKRLSTSTSTSPTLTAKGNVTKVKGPGQGKYTVRAGTFNSKEGARTRLEEVIKLRYPTAEVTQLRNGKWAVVILRTNDRTKANRMVNELVGKGVDAALF